MYGMAFVSAHFFKMRRNRHPIHYSQEAKISSENVPCRAVPFLQQNRKIGRCLPFYYLLLISFTFFVQSVSRHLLQWLFVHSCCVVSFILRLFVPSFSAGQVTLYVSCCCLNSRVLASLVLFRFRSLYSKEPSIQMKTLTACKKICH